MKKQFLIFLCLVFAVPVFSQLPQGFKYQAIARDAQGNELVNQAINVRLSVLSGGATGTNVWQETHAPTTNAYGLYDLVVGQGIGTGSGVATSFDAIDWSTEDHFLKIEVDFGGGYLDMGTIQLLPVPYALYAAKSQTRFADGEFALINENDKAVNPTAAPTVFVTGAPGNLEAGSYAYKITYITDAGETGPGPVSAQVTVPSPGQVMLTNIPISAESSVRERGVYRRFGASGTYNLVTVIQDNTTTFFTDNIANDALGNTIPGENLTESGASFDLSGLSRSRQYALPDKNGTLVVDDSTEQSIDEKINRSYELGGLATIRSHFNGMYIDSYMSGEWIETYTVSEGTDGSVDSVDAYFKDQSYQFSNPADYTDDNIINITNQPEKYGGLSNAFDRDPNTYASVITHVDHQIVDFYFGKEWADLREISRTRLKVMIYASTGWGSCVLQIHDGTSWVNEATLSSYSYDDGGYKLYDGVYELNKFTRGIRIHSNYDGTDGSQRSYIYELDYSEVPVKTENLIVHAVEPGIFSENIRSAIGVAMIDQWEEGNEIQYKLINGTDDSGWLTPNEPTYFTPFTSEPTKVIVKLIPKAENPTPGVPAIKGFYITEL